MEKYVKAKAFEKRELVLRRTFDEGKLRPNWEGPYIVMEYGWKGAYMIQSPKGKEEPKP